MPSVKKGKKDAKEAGGVVAAVTKHASGKFISNASNANTPGSVSDTSNSSSAHSPNIGPVATPSSNGNPSVSPMLGAVGASATPSSAPLPQAIPGMSEWTSRGGLSHALSASPGNLINLVGESPPSRWSSPRPYYGTSHTSQSHLSHASHGSHPTSVSVSPPMMSDLHGMPGRRPMSYHVDSTSPYPSLSHVSPHTLPSHLASSPGHRRDSLHSHYAQSRGVAAVAAVASSGLPTNPPLPHQPQAHFYGVPDIDLDLQPRQAGMKPGQRGYHFSFDALPSALLPSGSPETAVTAGYEGGLEVHSVSKRGIDPLASLTGLRGGVYDAKILPWTVSSAASADLFPLVAVVVHGPVLPTASPETGMGSATGVDTGPANGLLGLDAKSGTTEVRGPSPHPSPKTDARDFGSRGRAASGSGLPIQYYQTTVEIYSLKLNRHVCTLLEASRIPLEIAITSPVFQAPPPSGAFHIRADAGTIVVSSGMTGECWVYRQMALPGSSELPVVFVAKLWTALQPSPKGTNPSDPTTEGERARAASSASSVSSASTSLPRMGLKQPILSLSGKWLAYCPATPSSQISLRASVPLAVFGRAPGYSSMTPPHLPSTTADVDLPQAESMMNKIMRDATQELISSAKWVGQQGWQAFNSYWKGSAGASAPQPPRSPPVGGYASRLDGGQFPPTHGGPLTAVTSKDPGLVSVVDITTLSNSATIHPLATFSPPLGCSFLSFNPTGLWLFTASTKGDVQTVWDLFRIQYTKASPLQAFHVPGVPMGPRVRQIAQFSRLTVARIVDVEWTRPNGERLAMVTERGTVHVLDMPSSAFTWPPPRRRGMRPQDTAAGGPGAIGGADAGTGGATGAASNAVSYLATAIDAARPLLTRPRRSSTNLPQSAGAAIVDHASHGGKMIAAGISHSLGKTGNAINQLRHTGENRVSLPAGLFAPGPSCAVWVSGKRHHSLFVLGDGLVRNFVSRTRKKSSGQRVLHLGHNKDFRVPSVPDDILATMIKHYLDPEEFLDFVDPNDAGSNTMILNGRRRYRSADASAVEFSIPHAEIESSAPYQPFHTDRRIALYEYEYSPAEQRGSEAAPAAEPSAPAPAPAPAAPPAPSPACEPPIAELSALTISPRQMTPPPLSFTGSELPQAVNGNGKAKTLKQRAKAAADARKLREAELAAAAAAAAAVAPTVVAPAVVAPIGNGHGSKNKAAATRAKAAWAFGQPIIAVRVDTGFPPMTEEESFNISFEETRALPASAMERVCQHVDGDEQIVVTTRRRRGGGRAAGDEDEDGFFEDDCEVLDFADQRV